MAYNFDIVELAEVRCMIDENDDIFHQFGAVAVSVGKSLRTRANQETFKGVLV